MREKLDQTALTQRGLTGSWSWEFLSRAGFRIGLIQWLNNAVKAKPSIAFHLCLLHSRPHSKASSPSWAQNSCSSSSLHVQTPPRLEGGRLCLCQQSTWGITLMDTSCYTSILQQVHVARGEEDDGRE